MSDPVRWRDGGGAPGDLGALLADAPRSQPMSALDEARMAARIAGVAAAPVGASAAIVWLRRAGLASGVGVAVVVATLALSSGRARPPLPPGAHVPPAAAAPAGAHTESTPRETPNTLTPSPSGIVEVPVVPLAPSPVATPRDRRPTSRAAVRPPTPPAVTAPIAAPRPVDTMAAEAALLGRAQAALVNNPGEALARADEWASRFPRGQLAPEREFIAVDALQRLGRTGEARARGEAMIAMYPRSIYAARVRRILEGGR